MLVIAFSLGCVLVVFFTIQALASIFQKYNYLYSNLERLLLASSLFVVTLNINFAALSLLPLSNPINKLAIPLHVLMMTLLIGACGIKRLRGFTADTILEFRELSKSIGRSGNVLLLFAALLLFLYFLQGVFTVPTGVDEMAYHAPQAIGIVQEGRLRTFQVPPDWVFHYPPGSASLWAFTMLFTQSDMLFKPVQLFFGVQLVAAAVLLARRSGADIRASLLVGAVMICMPIFYFLTTTLGSDIGYHAGIVMALAFLAPPLKYQSSNEFDKCREHDLMAAAICISQSVLIKIPIIALIAAFLGLIGFLIVRVGRGNILTFANDLSKSPLFFVVALVMMICTWPYGLNWIGYENPFYPLTLKIGDHVVFHGPLAPIDEIYMAHSTFGPVKDMSLVKRWYVSFTDIFQPLNQDAMGSSGFIYPAILLFTALVTMIDALIRRRPWLIMLTVFCAVTLFIPAAYAPRYSLSFLTIIAVLAFWTFTRIRISIPTIYQAFAFILALSLYFPLDNLTRSYKWIAAQAPPLTIWQDRGRSILEKINVDSIHVPSPQMLQVIRNQIGRGDTLFYSVPVHSYLMWNRDYSNNIQYVSPNNEKNWVLEVQSGKPDYILIYNSSELKKTIVKSDLRYSTVYSDSIIDTESGLLEMVLLKIDK